MSTDQPPTEIAPAGRLLTAAEFHRLASIASLFEYLCEKNAVTHNPVEGVERPRSETGEGKKPALGDHQARKPARSTRG